VTALEDYIRLHKMPRHIAVKVQYYFQFVWQRFEGIDEEAVVAELPDDLRADVLVYRSVHSSHSAVGQTDRFRSERSTCRASAVPCNAVQCLPGQCRASASAVPCNAVQCLSGQCRASASAIASAVPCRAMLAPPCRRATGGWPLWPSVERKRSSACAKRKCAAMQYCQVQSMLCVRCSCRWREMVMKGDIFKARPEAFRRSVLKLLKTRFFMPGDSFYVYGQPAAEMYFIIDGSAVVRLCCASPLTVRRDPSVRYVQLHMPCRVSNKCSEIRLGRAFAFRALSMFALRITGIRAEYCITVGASRH
jgi:hypothetical protein